MNIFFHKNSHPRSSEVSYANACVHLRTSIRCLPRCLNRYNEITFLCFLLLTNHIE